MANSTPSAPAATPLTWSSCTATHVGAVRKLNEDSALDRSDIGLWVVADGMGGHAAGDLASQLIVNTLAKIPPPETLSAFVDAVDDAIIAVNKRLFGLSKESNQTSGSTVVALLIHGRHCVYLWAGDSRAYRLRRGRIQQLTTDHSQVEMLVEQGLITREEALRHPAGNMVTRAVGAAEDLYLEMDVDEIEPGDRYLLCSDGLDKHVADAELERLLGQGTLAEVARNLIDVALSRGGSDNVTVALVEIRGATAPRGIEVEAEGDTTIPFRDG